MPEPMSIPSLKTIFKFPFQGEGWGKRFLIGTVLTFLNFVIPIIPAVFISGYMLEVMRRTIQGEDLVLPDWTDWGKLGVDGLKYILVSLVFLLPGSLVYVVGFGLYFFATFGLSLASGVSQNSQGVQAIFVPVFLLAMLVFVVSMFAGPLLFFLGAIPLPVAAANMAVEGRLAAGFSLGQWWPALWKNKLGYFITWTILFGLFFTFYLVIFTAYITCILCWLIPFLMGPLGFYLAMVYAALFGQTFRESMQGQADLHPAEPATPAAPVEVVPPSEPAQPEDSAGTVEVSQP